TLGFPEEALDRQTRTYSTGMRQMIGITLAFQHEPEMLILDEPTTGLDPIVRAAFLDIVRDVRARGATVCLSTHVLDEVDRVADRIGLVAHAKRRMVERVEDLRRTWPRHIRVQLKDGTTKQFETHDVTGGMLDEIRALDPVDVEIAKAGLDDVFRA